MRVALIAVGWVASIVVAFFAGALVLESDGIGWNYAEDSYREIAYQRDVLADLVTSNDTSETEQMNFERILVQRNDAPFQKGFEYEAWEVSTLFGLYKASSDGEILEFCFSDIDQDGICKAIENLNSYVTLRAACEGEA